MLKLNANQETPDKLLYGPMTWDRKHMMQGFLGANF